MIRAIMKSSVDSTASKRKIIAVMLTVFLSVAAGVLISKVNIVPWNTIEAMLILTLTFLSLAPLLHNWYTSLFDIFEPVYMVGLITLIAFVAVPIWMLLHMDISTARGGGYWPELAGAIALSSIGLLGFYFGYYISLSRWRHNPEGQFVGWVGRSLDRYSAYRWSWVGLLATVLIFIVWLLIGHVSLSSLNVLASDTQYGTATRSAQNSIIYLFKIRTSWPILLLLVYAYRPPGKVMVVFPLIWGLALAVYVASGDRSLTLQMLVATAVYLYLARAKRPSLWSVLIFLFSFALLAGGIVSLRGEYNTSPSQRVGDHAFLGVERDLTKGGAANGMMILLQIFPDKVGFLTWDIFKPVLYMPIPRVLWPEKPSTSVIAEVAGRFVSNTHAPPIFGPFYAGFGVPGVVVSMALFGMVSAWIYSLWRQRAESGIAMVLLATWIGFLWTLYHRGGIIWIMTNTLYIFGPIFLVAILAKSRISTESG